MRFFFGESELDLSDERLSLSGNTDFPDTFDPYRAYTGSNAFLTGIRFTTDSSVTKRGWQLVLSEMTCAATATLEDKIGSFSDRPAGMSSHYSMHQRCQWVLPSTSVGYRVWFSRFDVQTGHDYVTILRNVTSVLSTSLTTLGNYSGSLSSNPLIPTESNPLSLSMPVPVPPDPRFPPLPMTERFHIHFLTDDSAAASSHAGWTLHYAEIQPTNTPTPAVTPSSTKQGLPQPSQAKNPPSNSTPNPVPSRSVDKGEGCQVVQHRIGSISDGSDADSEYSSNLDICWELLPSHTGYLFLFVRFDLGSSGDTVSLHSNSSENFVFSGVSEDVPLHPKGDLPVLIAASFDTTFAIRFRTDEQHTGLGWELVYEEILTCFGEHILEDKAGWFSDGSQYWEKYTGNIRNCHWEFPVTDLGYIVWFSRFHTEANYDEVSFHFGSSSERIHAFSGTRHPTEDSPLRISFDSRTKLSVQFNTDATIEFNGWALHYQEIFPAEEGAACETAAQCESGICSDSVCTAEEDSNASLRDAIIGSSTAGGILLSLLVKLWDKRRRWRKGYNHYPIPTYVRDKLNLDFVSFTGTDGKAFLNTLEKLDKVLIKRFKITIHSCQVHAPASQMKLAKIIAEALESKNAKIKSLFRTDGFMLKATCGLVKKRYMLYDQVNRVKVDIAKRIYDACHAADFVFPAANLPSESFKKLHQTTEEHPQVDVSRNTGMHNHSSSIQAAPTATMNGTMFQYQPQLSTHPVSNGQALHPNSSELRAPSPPDVDDPRHSVHDTDVEIDSV